MIRLLIHNFRISFEAILQNKLRAVLTSLGIIFGVASVIAMLAIGRGAEQEILEKMKLLGTNNIIIKPVDKTDTKNSVNDEESETTTEDITKQKKSFSPGLTMQDAKSIESIPNVKFASPVIEMETMALHHGLKRNIKLIGISEHYFKTNNAAISEGSFFGNIHFNKSLPVCIIGSGVKSRLFPKLHPIGKKIKCGSQWLTVIGVIKERNISRENIQNLGLRDFNYDVYTPITTMLLRFENRALVTARDLEKRRSRNNDKKDVNLNQLDKIIVNVDNTGKMNKTAEVIGRMLLRRHSQEVDYEVIVPELLLEQEQRTKSIFNIVLGAIASISLIVGGIGIMNIMLASVMERIKEIGVRRAVGARQRDVLMQFLSEAVSISLTGGIFGIIMGFILSFIIEKLTGINTIVTPLSVFVSFAVSISVGIVFGIMPARRASLQNPIESLRYE